MKGPDGPGLKNETEETMISLTIHFGVVADPFDPQVIWLLMLALAIVTEADKRAERRRKAQVRKTDAPRPKKPPGPRPG